MFFQGRSPGWRGLLAMSGVVVACAIEGATSLHAQIPDAPAVVTETTTAPPVTEVTVAADAPAGSGTPTAETPPVPAEVKPAPPPAPKPKPAAPKKKVPPVFPGPKNLPPTGPYKGVFFDNDFSYKKEPKHDYVFGEETKLVPLEFLDTNFVFSTGGEIRHRYMNQDNRLQPGGPGRDTYNLWRWRHYVDLKAGDRVRFYLEGIDAESFGQDLPIQAIDQNRWDLQNAFVDVKLFDLGSSTHTIRYGRQELLFGRQRVVSPLDWANTRRNFEGFRYLVKDKDWKLDLFSVNPVNSATGFATVAKNANAFDQANRNVRFSGAYFTYTGIENANLDVYYLWLEDRKPALAKADGRRHTIGTRYSELIPVDGGRVWDLDVEGGYQFGEDNNKTVNAGFATAVLGHTWKEAPWTPRVSGLFYYGSGDRNLKDGQNNTFYTMFPLGHAYWGISDNLSGQNLLDYSMQVDVKPTKKLGATSAYHFFNLASGGDRAYNVAGVPVGTPGNGTNLGQALDTYGYYSINTNVDIQMGYSWFWYGTFIDRTTHRGDSTQAYIQTTIRY